MTVSIELLKSAAYAVLLAHLLHEATHYVISWLLGGQPRLAINGLGDGLLQYVGTLEVHHADIGADRLHLIAVAPFGLGLIAGLSYLKFFAGPGSLTLPVVVGWLVYTVIGLPWDMRLEEVDTESTV